MTHEEHHRALVARLAGELTPARRLWPVGARLALWLAAGAAVTAWVLFHARSDLISTLMAPSYAIEVAAFGVAAIISAGLALKSAIPGRAMRAAEAVAVVALAALGTTLVIIGQPAGLDGRLGEFLRGGLPCALATGVMAAPPWLGLWWAVRWGAPMRGGVSGIWVGAGAATLAFALMRIACPIDEPFHLITWHLLPACTLVALSALAGSAWLGLRLHLLRHPPAA